jgi:hypothetical protein
MNTTILSLIFGTLIPFATIGCIYLYFEHKQKYFNANKQQGQATIMGTYEQDGCPCLMVKMNDDDRKWSYNCFIPKNQMEYYYSLPTGATIDVWYTKKKRFGKYWYNCQILE